MRIDGRSSEALRPVRLQPGFSKFAEGSCLISVGDTVVLCNASVEEKVPPHVRSGGWITAEYSMLPRANRQRSPRDISKLKLASRSAEIQIWRPWASGRSRSTATFSRATAGPGRQA